MFFIHCEGTEKHGFIYFLCHFRTTPCSSIKKEKNNLFLIKKKRARGVASAFLRSFANTLYLLSPRMRRRWRKRLMKSR